MKKLIIITLIVLVFFSCKNDDSVQPLDVGYDQIVGKWYFEEIINVDGTTSPYPQGCPAQRDYVKFNQDYTMNYEQFYADCVNGSDQWCNDLYVYENEIVNICTNVLDGPITEITTTRMRIEYNEVENIANNINVKGVIFSK